MKIKIYFNFCSVKKLVAYVLFTLSIFLSEESLAQKNGESQKFDSIYFETAVTVSARDINKAIGIADSLYRHSSLELHKLKALMLSSSLFQQKGDIKTSIQYAKKADKLAVKYKFYDWEARIAGFLSTQYRLMGLYEEGEEYLEKGKEVSRKVDNEHMKVLFLGLIYQETAYYKVEYEDYNAAYLATENADVYFKQIEDELNRNFFLATNQELFGRICVGLKKWDEALHHFNESLDKLGQVTPENAMLSAFVYSGLGRVYLEKKDLAAAFENLRKAENLVEQADYLGLKIEVFKTLAEYYQLTEDYVQSSLYNTKYVEALELNEKKKKESITDFVNSTKSQGKQLAYNRNVLLIVSIVLFVVIILTLIWHRRSRKRDFKRFKAVMNKMRNNQYPEERLPEKEMKEPEKKKLMSEAVEAKILHDLEAFEKGTRYTDKHISLSLLAGMLNTNTKYLSYVLNTYKHKDFNTYINELRINYIIEKMEKNDEFRNYKLSALAEECGFSSHSKFSAVFKSVTGLPPSVFLGYMEKSSSDR